MYIGGCLTATAQFLEPELRPQANSDALRYCNRNQQACPERLSTM
jgi:hypothetical protein